jgi:hypothetical protein
MRMPSDKEANASVFTIDPTFGEMAVQMGEAVWSGSDSAICYRGRSHRSAVGAEEIQGALQKAEPRRGRE